MAPFGDIVIPLEPKNFHAAIAVALAPPTMWEKRPQEVGARIEQEFRNLAFASIFQVGDKDDL
jgi:hypothetical protein